MTTNSDNRAINICLAAVNSNLFHSGRSTTLGIRNLAIDTGDRSVDAEIERLSEEVTSDRIKFTALITSRGVENFSDSAIEAENQLKSLLSSIGVHSLRTDPFMHGHTSYNDACKLCQQLEPAMQAIERKDLLMASYGMGSQDFDNFIDLVDGGYKIYYIAAESGVSMLQSGFCDNYRYQLAVRDGLDVVRKCQIGGEVLCTSEDTEFALAAIADYYRTVDYSLLGRCGGVE